MSIDFHVIIPARLHSTRLPGKMLLDLAGKTVLERVYRQVEQSKPTSITIATDHQDICTIAQAFGAEVMLTSVAHQSGTDRVAEVVEKMQLASNAIVVNVQGDEPLISPKLITQVAHALSDSEVPVATLCWPIDTLEQVQNPNVVKVVRNRVHHALYFSRSAIPAHRDNPTITEHMLRHIGLYAYRAHFLLDLVRMPPCDLENIEALEQLRVLWHGHHIKVVDACVQPLQDVNTLEDLERVRQYLSRFSPQAINDTRD